MLGQVTVLFQRGGPHQTFPMASRAGSQCPSSPYRRGAVPGAFLQGHGTLQVGGRSRSPLPGHPLEAVLRSPSGTAGGLWPCRRPSLNTPILVLSPPRLCSAWACGAGRCLHTRALRSLGSGAAITWVFHTLPCQGRVGAGGRGQEERGAGRGNQLHESPCSRWAGQPQEAPLPLDKVQRTRWHQPTGTG